jgi:hypothetical protein
VLTKESLWFRSSSDFSWLLAVQRSESMSMTENSGSTHAFLYLFNHMKEWLMSSCGRCIKESYNLAEVAQQSSECEQELFLTGSISYHVLGERDSFIERPSPSPSQYQISISIPISWEGPHPGWPTYEQLEAHLCHREGELSFSSACMVCGVLLSTHLPAFSMEFGAGWTGVKGASIRNQGHIAPHLAYSWQNNFTLFG